MLLVSYLSRKAFVAMAADPEYLRNAHPHRDAVLEDSRLIVSAAVSDNA